jgi:hypothetical protein
LFLLARKQLAESPANTMSKHSNRTSTSISNKASKAERAAAIEAAMQAKAQEQATTESTTAEQPAAPVVEAPPVESPTTDSQAPQAEQPEQPAQSGKKARILAPVDARAKLGVDRNEFRAKRGSGMELMLVLMSQPGGVTWDALLAAQSALNNGRPQPRSQTMGGIRWAAQKGWGVSGTVVPGALVLVDRDGNRVYYQKDLAAQPEQPHVESEPHGQPTE